MSNAIELAKAEGRLTLNIDEIPAILGCSRALAYEMARSGRLPIIRLGERRLVVPIDQLEKMLQGAGVER